MPRTRIKIGSTTGNTRSIMERSLPLAERQGLMPDNLVCAGDTLSGRPTPLMMYKCPLALDVWPAANTVNVDDTEVGIQEGVAADRPAGNAAVDSCVTSRSTGRPPSVAVILASALRRGSGKNDNRGRSPCRQ